VYLHALSTHISPIGLQVHLTGHDLSGDLANLHLGMVRGVCVVVVYWDGGICLPPYSSIVEINYQTNMNHNYK
jgi:hypothetical protein